MAAIDGGLIEDRLRPDDAEAALQLSAEAGWNQTAADWRFMLDAGQGVGVRDGAGRWLGSALALPLGPRLAWISMVLVAKEARRRGLGTGLLRSALDLAREGDRVAGLDATELGRPVYRPLGFRDLYPVSRLQLDRPAGAELPPPAGCTIRPLRAEDLASVAAFDGPRSAMRRGHVLAYLLQQAPEAAFVAEIGGRIAGYAFGRPGRTAFQIGPVVADDETVASALVSAALSRLSGPALLDMPDAHAALRAFLDRAGALRERGFMRMTLGEPPAGLADPRAIFALAGPELG